MLTLPPPMVKKRKLYPSIRRRGFTVRGFRWAGSIFSNEPGSPSPFLAKGGKGEYDERGFQGGRRYEEEKNGEVRAGDTCRSRDSARVGMGAGGSAPGSNS